jgi:carbonic anhydrase
MVINHTDCGLMKTDEADMRSRIKSRTGSSATITPPCFHSFQDVEENVRRQLQKLQSHPWIPESVTIRGFVYDVTTGLLREIQS